MNADFWFGFALGIVGTLVLLAGLVRIAPPRDHKPIPYQPDDLEDEHEEAFV